MPYNEDELLPISALQHLLFCERQCALIHIERVWAENRWTAEGRVMHNKAHQGEPETRDGERITRGLPLRSYEMGLIGQADVVLWRPPSDAESSQGKANRSIARLLKNVSPEELRKWLVTPVEYKRGRPKKDDCDRVQICAQAMCLEEMLGVEIGRGDLFYGQKRRRMGVEFDDALRETTRGTAERLHSLIRSQQTPRAVREPKCDQCSLIQLCMPDAMKNRRSAQRFLEAALTEHLE